jgi:hypothetical protein
MNRIWVTILAGSLLPFAVTAQPKQPVNLTGTWQIEYHDKNGKEVDTPTISLLQADGRLDGVFGNKHWKVQGALEGKQVRFSFSPPGHPEVTVRYQGTVDSPTEMHGTMASEVQSGTFTAKRKW